MTVYMNNQTTVTDEITNYLNEQFTKTGRAKLLTLDLKKWGSRIFNLTVGELIVKFDIEYVKSLEIVHKYFKSNGLKINSKFHYSHNLYDYPIKE